MDVELERETENAAESYHERMLSNGEEEREEKQKERQEIWNLSLKNEEHGITLGARVGYAGQATNCLLRRDTVRCLLAYAKIRRKDDNSTAG